MAADLKRSEDIGRGTIEVSIDGMDEPLRILKSIAIFGPNGSGKSTVWTAAKALNWLATESSPLNRPGARLGPYEPFLLDDKSIHIPDSRVVVSFLHAGKAAKPLNFDYESSGTKKLFNLSGDWWKLANEDITLFADELSASLHPTLLDYMVRTNNDSPRRSQLIFATHEAGLLESREGKPPALRRDQVYFTRKSTEGSTDLYSLAEFKDSARSVHIIRKRYLSGLYGALPSVDGVSLGKTNS